ncbi:MAG: amino acid permease [Kiloniellales bacterium]
MTSRVSLKRSLSLPILTLYGLGTTVGAGIYVLIGEVAGRAGVLAPLSFLVAALLAGLTAFSFAELSQRYPKSAGEAVYIREGLRSSTLATAAGLAIALAGTVSASAIMIGAAGYAAKLLALPSEPLMIVLIALLGAVAVWGIAESAWIASITTLVEIGGLLLVVAAGADHLPAWSGVLAETTTTFDFDTLVAVFAGSMLAFYAFLGFEDMVNVAEEVKDVTRVLPIAIILTLVVTTVLYLAVSTVAVLAVPVDRLAGSEAPLVQVYQDSGGQWPKLLTAIGAFAAMNGALIQIIMSSRILYGLANQGALPPVFAGVNRITQTPILATLVVIAVVLLLALAFPIDLLAEATSVITLAVFALVNLSLVAIKRRETTTEVKFSLASWVPMGGFVASTAFLCFQAVRLVG